MRKLTFLSALLLIAASVSGEANEPIVQADIYNALYDAQVQCGADLNLSRSEFITDMIKRTSGQTISIEQIEVLLLHNVESAKQFITEKQHERERTVARILKGSSSQTDGEESERIESHSAVRTIDESLEEKKQYVKVHECVVASL